MRAYAPTIRKNIFKMPKTSKKNYHVDPDIRCARTKFRKKPTFFMYCVKRQKKSHAMPILAQKFVFFIHNTKMPFSCETTL
jgi:hypothetical protein